jgi:leader peptidase (prepilin peptidase) / N-methyltransferase
MDVILEIFKSNSKLYLIPDVISISRFLLFVIVSIFCIVSDIKKKEISSLVLIILTILSLIFDFIYNKTIFLYCLYGILFSVIVFTLIYLISKKGIGLGDMFYLSFFAGLYGYILTITAFITGFWAGTIILIIPLIKGKITRKTEIPFIPFLFTGGMIAISLTFFLTCFF